MKITLHKNVNFVPFIVLLQVVSSPELTLPEINVLERWRCTMGASGSQCAQMHLKTRKHVTASVGSWIVVTLSTRWLATSDLYQQGIMSFHEYSVQMEMSH